MLNRSSGGLFVQSFGIIFFVSILLISGFPAAAEPGTVSSSVLDFQKKADGLIRAGNIAGVSEVITTCLEANQRSEADAALEVLMAQSSDSAEFREALDIAAQAYCKKAKDPAKGRAIYNGWLEKYSSDPEAFKVRCSVVKTYLDEEDLAGARAAANTLLSDYVAQPGIAKTVREVADAYRKKNLHPDAVQLYRASITNKPKESEIIYTQRGLGCSLIMLGDLEGAEAATNALLSDYAAQPDAARMVRETGDVYYRENHCARAERLYRASINKWPKSSDIAHSYRGLACSLIKQGDTAGAGLARDKLLTDYASQPGVAWMIREVGDAYHSMRHFAEAEQLYRMSIHKEPDSSGTLFALRGLARSLARQEGDSAAAGSSEVDAIVQQLMTEYKDAPRLGYHIFLIGEEYYLMAERVNKNSDPNYPVWLADPNLADPNLSEGWYEWKYKYNYQSFGSSQYSIDLADLMTFLNDAPWLWKACWLDLEELQMQQMTFGGGEELLMVGTADQTLMTSKSSLVETNVASVIPAEAGIPTPQLSAKAQVLELKDSIDFLEKLWLEEPDIQKEISPEDWKQFMDSVYDSLWELQSEPVLIE